MKPIYITNRDKARLEELLARIPPRSGQDVSALVKEIARAEVVESADVRPGVVTMNSRVILQDVDSHEEMEYSLVFPHEANPEAGAISVLAPIGTAILGYSKGDTITWPVPGGVRHLRIKDVVYQPEAAGSSQ
ncbi:MAG: nucleoside diphosphate kinase regulator [Kiritimatiellae bacterium]|nr:nucleoside diphosphate kinase regulator [Kiritimatiellia bacterium]MCO5067878.1 nucleoside diphosphate kinase regulator [Kiritimatiellia bacterium]